LANSTIFFEGKRGLDANGYQAQRGQHRSKPGRPSVDADKIPFIVLPGGGFAAKECTKLRNLGIEKDVLYFVFRDRGSPV
jgi:hypothetical protein